MAKELSGRVLTTLAHHIDVPFLQEAYRRTRKDGAVGVDGQTAEAYAEHLDENLTTLLNRFKAGTYHAPPVRRAYIPKEGSPTGRPIAVPTFEDKVLQRTVAMVLEAVYEQEFLDCSYGFRPKRSPHLALEVIRQMLMEMRGGWIIKIDGRFEPAQIVIHGQQFGKDELIQIAWRKVVVRFEHRLLSWN